MCRKVPRSALYLSIRDPAVVATPAGKAYADLACAVTCNLLSDESYMALSAELEMSVKTDEAGFVIMVWGFSHHVSALAIMALKTLVSVIRTSQKQQILSMERDALARKYRNADANPSRQASNRCASLLFIFCFNSHPSGLV